MQFDPFISEIIKNISIKIRLKSENRKKKGKYLKKILKWKIRV